MTHNELGETGEAYVYHVLRSVWLTVQRKGPADLLVEGIPVEVKAAKSAPYRSGKYTGYQFCMHRDGRGGLQGEVVICLCYWHKEKDPVAFVIPADQVGRRRKVTITGDPWSYSGRWSSWYRRWEIIADLLEAE